MNITRSLLKLTTTLAFAVLCAGSAAQFMEAKEYAAELENVEFGNAPTTNGLIYIRRCDHCHQQGVTFRAQTQFFDGKRPITAVVAEKLTGRGATLLFDPDSRYVSRVIFWPASK